MDDEEDGNTGNDEDEEKENKVDKENSLGKNQAEKNNGNN